MAEPSRTWQLRDARAHFGTLVDKAVSEGLQIEPLGGGEARVPTITVRGAIF
jgi:hypothetical protein